MRSRHLIVVLCGLVSAAAPLHALDPGQPISQSCVRSWTAEDGLPQNSVNAIAQTRDGYLWLATQEGVARFDGVRFKPMLDGRPVHRDPISSLVLARDGSLWIGGSTGLIRYEKGRITTYGKAQGLADENVWSLAEGADGSIWIATYSAGVSRFKDGRFTSYTTADGLPSNSVWSLWPGRDGSLWIGTNGGGVSRMQDGKFTNFGVRDGLSDNVVWSVYEDHRGQVWIGTGRGLCQVRGGKVVRVPLMDDLDRVPVKAVYEDRQGTLWIGTDGRGLVRFAGGAFSRPRPGSPLWNGGVISLMEDAEGSLWAGTTSNGLYQLRASKFTMIGVPEGLGSDEVWTLAETGDGSIVVGTNNGLARVKDGKVVTRAPSGSTTPGSMIRTISVAPDGAVWYGTYAGAMRLAGGEVTRYRTSEGLSHEIARALTVDRHGAVWIGTRGGGLNVLRNGVMTTYKTSDGLPSDVILGMEEAADGSLWIATYGGVSHFDGGRFTNYTARQGLSSETVRVVHNDGGAVWIGTYGGGLNRLKNGRITAIREKDGLFDDVVFAILDDRLGNFWMTSNRGIFRVSKQELNDFADGKIKAVRSIAYDSSDGMRMTECNSGWPAALRARDGRLYFATLGGVAVVDPAHIPRNAVPPPVWIEEVRLEDQPTVIDGGRLSIDRGARDLEIHYTALSLVAPKKVDFRYRLRGFNDDWVDAQDRRVAYYTNVPPGKYTFEVRASNDDGMWGEVANPLRIRIRAAFYQTRWFWIACALLGAAAVRAGFSVRVRYLRQRERLLAQRVREQTAELSTAKQSAEQAADDIRRLSRRNQLILDSAGEGIFGLDVHGIATFINPSAARMLGWPVPELLGRELHGVIHAEEEGTGRREECAMCSATIHAPSHAAISADFRRRNGSMLSVEYTASVIRGELGESQGVVVTFRDVTQQRAVERMKDEFVSTVSHELRTPLTSIRGALGLLGSGTLELHKPKAQQMLRVAMRNADRLVRLINDILDQERIESGRMELVRHTADAYDLIAQAVESVQAMADDAGIRIVVESVHAELCVDGDRIVQTLTNLLGNAIKFSPPRTRVTVGGTTAGGQFVFHVADQGRGIPEDKLRMIFERFTQVDASDARQKGGTGLGLSICRSIVHAHGGDIWAENGENGSVFRFTVPAAAMVA